jgi:hypothetical protein
MSRRLPLTTGSVARGAAALVVVAAVVAAHPAAARPTPYAGPTPQAHCGPGSLTETAAQGRVPAKDYADGRAKRGYRCNTSPVGHFGATGGYKVLRYVDAAGHQCGFYDTTLLFPKDALTNGAEGLGVYVMDMKNSRRPEHVGTLSTPAMLSPHESLLLNQKRGLLVADMGYPTWNPGFVDVYSVKDNCLDPQLESSTPMGILGHESAFAPDGRTFYVSSTGGHTITAVDLTDPTKPVILWATFDYDAHGMRVSDDGRTLYVADLGTQGFPGPGSATPGLTILDVSQVQKRVPNPQVTQIAHLTWPNVSIPQVPIPVRIHGHSYLVEIDEFSKSVFSYNAADPVGAARIINIDNPRKPFVVSNMRLAADQTRARAGDQQQDPQATNGLQGYAGHYCNVPRETDPGIVACSFILSGERVFDIRDPYHPREIAYFNMPRMPDPNNPLVGGGYAMSAPAFVPSRHEIWYSDGDTGLWVFRVTNGMWPASLR